MEQSDVPQWGWGAEERETQELTYLYMHKPVDTDLGLGRNWEEGKWEVSVLLPTIKKT